MQNQLKNYPAPSGEGFLSAPPIETGKILHLSGTTSKDHFDHETANKHGFKEMLVVPIMQAERIRGAQVPALPYDQTIRDGYVEPIRSFADQANIAIENARPYAELNKALSHQAATLEILKAIRPTPTVMQPIPDVIDWTVLPALAGVARGLETGGLENGASWLNVRDAEYAGVRDARSAGDRDIFSGGNREHPARHRAGGRDDLAKPVNQVPLKAHLVSCLEKPVAGQAKNPARRLRGKRSDAKLQDLGFTLGGRRAEALVLSWDVRDITARSEK